MGHINQERQYLQSTRIATVFQPTLEDIEYRVSKLKYKVTPAQNFKQVLENDIHTDTFLSSDSPNKRGNVIYYTIEPLTPNHTA